LTKYIYPLTITLTGGPQDLNIVLGNTTSQRTLNNIDTNITIGNPDVPFTQTSGYQDSLSVLSAPVITSTLTLPESQGEPADNFTQSIVTNTTTLPGEEFYSGTTPVSELADISSTTVSTHSDKLAAPHKGIDSPASTTSSESKADDLALDDEILDDMAESAEETLDGIPGDSELSDYTGILPEDDIAEATSTPTQELTGTDVLSEETKILTTSTLAQFTTIGITTETVSVISTETTGISGNSISISLWITALLAAMIFVSGIAAVLFIYNI
jgi:hypothetical protein